MSDDWMHAVAGARHAEATAAREMTDDEVLERLRYYNDPGNEPIYGDADLWGVYLAEGARRWGSEMAAIERIDTGITE